MEESGVEYWGIFYDICPLKKAYEIKSFVSLIQSTPG